MKSANIHCFRWKILYPLPIYLIAMLYVFSSSRKEFLSFKTISLNFISKLLALGSKKGFQKFTTSHSRQLHFTHQWREGIFSRLLKTKLCHQTPSRFINKSVPTQNINSTFNESFFDSWSTKGVDLIRLRDCRNCTKKFKAKETLVMYYHFFFLI